MERRTSRTIPFPLGCSTSTYFYVARNGIYHLMQSLGSRDRGVVLVPDYHHGNEIYAMKAAGVKLRYYPVRKNLNVDLDAVADLCNFEPKPFALYVTHFIGWPQPMNEIQGLCREKNLTLIEDCALSFMSTFEGKPLGTFGSYAVFCLYKTLPVPNGGVLVANNGANPDGFTLRPCSALSVGASSMELILRWIRSRHERCGRALFAMKRVAGRTLTATKVRRVPIGDTGFEVSAVNTAMSQICHTMLDRFPYNRIKETRRRNFRILEDHLRGRVALVDKTLADGMCPLFFPLLTRDKQTAASALAKRGIESVEFWNSGDPESHRAGSGAEFLRRHLLEIPIHQDVTPEAAEYTAKEILRLRLGLPA
ncbi:MAG TPA: DegT/DnrJ/EryC1/StrS family aminotransferase [Terriglobia bacterium]|nr:DegT/DnrJ/EryC1/StrS family aminotransferase [Terriglobia bacterium]